MIHQRLYNAALEQRQDAWRKQRKSLSFADQCRDLTELREADPEYRAINAQSEQVTLRRVDLAIKAFFRRLLAGKTPGYPRFKSLARFSGWGYTQSGWSLNAATKRLSLSGIGNIRIRGKGRNQGAPVCCEVMHRNDRWYVSVTIECQPKRSRGSEAVGLDWGVTTFATLAHEDGRYSEIQNPRLLAVSAKNVASIQRKLSKKKLRSENWYKVKWLLSTATRKVAAQRHDFLHKTSAMLVGGAHLIATETLTVRNMTRAGGAHKRGLNRAILDTAPATFLSMLKAKAEEAACDFIDVPTRKVKPSQTCSSCGLQAPKLLSQREHVCPCGLRIGRDENGARVNLNWALNLKGQELTLRGGGSSGVVVDFAKLPPTKHETLPIAAVAWVE